MPELSALESNGAVGTIECMGLEQVFSLSSKVPKIDPGLIFRIVPRIAINYFVKSL